MIIVFFYFRFPPESVRTIIQTILHDELKGKKYDQHMAGQWTRQISDKIKKSIKGECLRSLCKLTVLVYECFLSLKDLDYPRYKLVVQVLFCEQKNEGVRFCSKCLWDPEADNYTSYTYSNVTMSNY